MLGIGQTGIEDRAEATRFELPSKRLVVCESIQALTDELSRCAVVCSMKFHGCVVAHMMGIPTISLSGADKFVSFFRMTGRSNFLSSREDPLLASLLDRELEPPDADQVQRLRRDARAGIEALDWQLRDL